MNSRENPTIRLATLQDVETIIDLQQQAISILQKGYLDPDQIEASRLSMGLDTQLIEDRTYFCVIEGDTIIGCGGWSFRETLYGNNDSQGRNARLLDPKTERARIRAMYTHPDHTKKGVGRMILEASEAAAKKAGFKSLEMAATEAGRPFYLKCGYTVEKSFFDEKGRVPVPLYTMVKTF
ncbi:MAG: GNAT family N-acetyltransferase [Pseudomonadota bacterium]